MRKDTDTKGYFAERLTDNNSADLKFAAPRKGCSGELRRASSERGDRWMRKGAIHIGENIKHIRLFTSKKSVQICVICG